MRINLPSPVAVKPKGSRAKATVSGLIDVSVDIAEMADNEAPLALSVDAVSGGYGVRFLDGKFYIDPRKIARGGSSIKEPGRRGNEGVREGLFPSALFCELLSKIAGCSLSPPEKTFVEFYLDGDTKVPHDGEVVETERGMNFETSVRAIADDLLFVDGVLHLRISEPKICVMNHSLVNLFFGAAACDTVVGYYGPLEADRRVPVSLGSPVHARLFSCAEVEQAKAVFSGNRPDRLYSALLADLHVVMPEVFTFNSSDDVLARTVEFGVDALAPDLAFQDNVTISAWMNCRDAVGAWKVGESSAALEDCLDKDLVMIVSSLPKKQADELARCLDLCGERTMEFPSVTSSSPNPGSRR